MNNSFNMASMEEDKDDDAISRMRKTLEKMGNGPAATKRKPVKKRPDSSAAAKNHRFVRDGQVQVEKHALTRTLKSKDAHLRTVNAEERSKTQLQTTKLKNRIVVLQKQVSLLSDDNRRLQKHQAELEALAARQKHNLEERNASIHQDDARISALEERLRQRDETIIKLRKDVSFYKLQGRRSDPIISKKKKTTSIAEPQDPSQPVKWWKD